MPLHPIREPLTGSRVHLQHLGDSLLRKLVHPQARQSKGGVFHQVYDSHLHHPLKKLRSPQCTSKHQRVNLSQLIQIECRQYDRVGQYPRKPMISLQLLLHTAFMHASGASPVQISTPPMPSRGISSTALSPLANAQLGVPAFRSLPSPSCPPTTIATL